jgi:hypothetical protein
MTKHLSELCSQLGKARNRQAKVLQENVRVTKRAFGHTVTPLVLAQLKVLTRDFGFSIAAGELQMINCNWYVTHTGLLRLARRKRCRGIHVEAVDSLCDSAANRFVLKATVYPSKDSAGFVGYGDADPCNVSLLVRGAEMRVSADSVSGAHWVFFLVFDHLARAARWAISRRCSGESAAALASPPFLAPSLDKATACGFFFFSPMRLGLYMPHPTGKNNNDFGA